MEELKGVRLHKTHLVIVGVLVFLLGALLFFGATPLGFSIAGSNLTFVNHSFGLVTEQETLSLPVLDKEIRAVVVSGTVIGNGTFSISTTVDGETYDVFTSEKNEANLVTGLAVDENSSDFVIPEVEELTVTQVNTSENLTLTVTDNATELVDESEVSCEETCDGTCIDNVCEQVYHFDFSCTDTCAVAFVENTSLALDVNVNNTRLYLDVHLGYDPACIDVDRDGVSVSGDVCGPIDCNDRDPEIYPGAYDLSGNGVDEDCDGSDAPGIVLFSPVNETLNTTEVTFSFGVHSNASTCVLSFGGRREQFRAESLVSLTYDLDPGKYNWSVECLDHVPVSAQFSILSEESVLFRDREGNFFNTETTVEDDAVVVSFGNEPKLVKKYIEQNGRFYTVEQAKNLQEQGGIRAGLAASVGASNAVIEQDVAHEKIIPISSIAFHGLNESADGSEAQRLLTVDAIIVDEILITEDPEADDAEEDELDEGDTLEDLEEQPRHERLYLIDPRNTSFDYAEVQIENAQGNTLNKCTDWNYEEEICNVPWVQVGSLSVGEDYVFNLSPEDPVFSESSEGIDVSLTALDNTTLVTAWIDDADDDASFKILSTDGTELVGEVDVDTSVDGESRIYTQALNQSHFVVAWVDGPVDDVKFVIATRDGTVGSTISVESSVGRDTDVAIGLMQDRFAVCFSDEGERDADFAIYDFSGTRVVNEKRVDGNMAPDVQLDNLIDCQQRDNNSFVYYWFDDAANDVTIRVASDTGALLTNQRDADSDVGGSGRVAGTVLDDRIAVAYYDSNLDDIIIRFATFSGSYQTTDTVATDLSSTRLAAGRVFNGSELLAVVAWQDTPNSGSNTVQAAVYASDGTEVTAPFVVDAQPDSVFRLVAVAGDEGSTSLCPGHFVVGYTNSSDDALFKGFTIDGSPWDGTCNETEELTLTIDPSVQNVSYLLNETAILRANVTGNVSSVTANLTFPDGSQGTISLIGEGILFNANLTNLTQRGNYSALITAVGATGTVSDTIFFSRDGFKVIDIIDANTTFLNYTLAVTANSSGLLNFSIDLDNHRVQSIEMFNHNESEESSILKLYQEDLPGEEKAFTVYAIDPEGINFTSALVTVSAVGTKLYKCKEWNFSAQNCDGTFVEFMNITPGQNYTFTLTPDDPGFLETTEAIDVALAPINETSLVIAWVDNNESDVSFKIMDTDGTVIVDTVDVDTNVDTTSRVSVVAINTTHFGIAWINGVGDAVTGANVTRAIYTYTGVQEEIFSVDTGLGLNSDVSIASLGDRQVVCYVRDSDNDAEFRIVNGSTVIDVGQVDGNIAPDSTLQNLVECAAFSQDEFLYAWYDDASNDATVRTVNNIGTLLTGQQDLDGNIGGTGQMSVTGLEGNKAAVAFYDSSAQDDITLVIRTNGGTTLFGPTDIDTNAGTISRVAVGTVREDENATADSFVVTWLDDNSGDIKAAVYNGSGTELTAPFTVEANPDGTFLLLDVVGVDLLSNNSLCPGTFAVGYTNSSDQGIFKTFFVNGTEWNGKCNENPFPQMKAVLPINQSIFGINETILLTAIVNDTDVDSVFARVNHTGVSEIINLNFNNITQIYEGNFTNTSALGTYTIQYVANDSLNQINDTVLLTVFIVQPEINITKTAPLTAKQGETITYHINYTSADPIGIVPIDFSTFIQVTDDAIGEDSPQMLVTDDETILIVYVEEAATDNIRVGRSTDKGDTFTLIDVDTSGDEDRFPNIFEDNAGTLWIAYEKDNGTIDLFLRNSTDDGLTWSAPLQITNGTFSEREPVLEQDSNDVYYVLFEAVIPPDGDSEIYLINSTDLVTWSAPLALTNNSYLDVDAEILIDDADNFLFTWAPANPDFQEIFFAQTAGPPTAGALDASNVQVTDNDFFDFEPSLYLDQEGFIHISWVGLLDVAQAPLSDVDRTSNEIFLGTSDNGGSTFALQQITSNNISDSYPGLAQTGTEKFWYLSFLSDVGGDMEVIFARRDAGPQDALNITISDLVPDEVSVTDVFQGGTDFGETVEWFFSVLYAGDVGSVSFNVTINETLPVGTVINNTANITYFDNQNRTVEIEHTFASTTVVDGLPPNVTDLTPVANTTLFGTAFLSANITDETSVNVTLAQVELPNGTFENVSLSLISGDIYGVNYSVSLLGQHNVTVFANDSMNNANFSESTFFTVVEAPFVAFTVTLPGEAPVNASNLTATAVMQFNSTQSTLLGVDPHVGSTGAFQTPVIPFFVYQNTGTANLTMAINLNSSFSTFRLLVNNVYNATNASEVNTSAKVIATSIVPNQTVDTFFFGDFINATASDSTTRTLVSNGT